MGKQVRQIYFHGPCLYLGCSETDRHYHPICPTCGAVWYGNMFCPECQKHHFVPTRKPGEHHCTKCVDIPPGPDFLNQLCGRCFDEVWDDWSEIAQREYVEDTA